MVDSLAISSKQNNKRGEGFPDTRTDELEKEAAELVR
jgi:hypothetical protein